MKRHLIACIPAFAAAMAGCDQPIAHWQGRNETNRSLITARYEQMRNNGLLTQQSIYPHHFVANGADLNKLGKRDLGVISEHYREYPGPLLVRRGDVSDDLYNARVQTVRQNLADAGVVVELVEISDGLPTSRGMTSKDVRAILADDPQQPAAQPRTTTTITPLPSRRAQP